MRPLSERRQSGRLRGTLLLAGMLLLGEACLPACQREATKQEPDRSVIFLLLDTARPDRFSIYGYPRQTTPAIDRWARTGKVFTQHYAQATTTRESLPRLLFSRYVIPPIFPTSARVPLAQPWELFERRDPAAISLPQVLAASGFHTAAISAHTWLRKGSEFAAEFDEMHDLSTGLRMDPRFGYARADRVTATAIDWLETNGNRDFFLYLHYMDAHFPHFPLTQAERWLDAEVRAAGERYFTPQGRPVHPEEPLTRAGKRYLDALYDGALAYLDHHLGTLFAWLRQHGRLESTLIVLTADHGEHLMEVPGRFEHGGPWYEKVARVPLIVAWPERLEPGRYEDTSEGVDVMPTILDLLNLQLPPGKATDGESLIPLLGAPEETRAAYAQGGVRLGQWKLVLPEATQTESNALLEAEAALAPAELDGQLYDLSSGPLETHNLWDTSPREAKRLLHLYANRLGPAQRRAAEARVDAAPSTPFAIAARHFEVAPREVLVQTTERLPAAGPVAAGKWLQSTHWKYYGLLGAAPAPPIQITVHLPSGRYRFSVSARGEAVVQDHGKTLCRIPGGLILDNLMDRSPTVEPTECGLVTVRGETLELEIQPSGESDVLIRYFGFTPVVIDTDAAEDAARRAAEERLRTLGYLE